MDKKKTILIAILSLIGFILTIELSVIFFKVNFNETFSASFCSVNSLIDCDGVAKTPYSMSFGIPLALWGMFLYILIMFLNFVHIIQNKFKNTFFDVFKNPKSYIATFGVLSFCISMLLAIISIFKINKICVLCFATYFIDLFIALIAKSKGGFFVEDIKNTIFDFIEGAKKYTILLIVVILAGAALLTYTTKSMVLSPNMKVTKSFREFAQMKKNNWATSGNTLGNPNSEIKVVVYSDFLCPMCKMTNIMVSKFAHEQKNTEVIHYNFPLDNSCNKYVMQTVHPGACELAKYAIAAGKQGKYWDMTNLLFDRQPKNESEILDFAAKDIKGLLILKLIDDVASDETKAELARQIEQGKALGMYGTPTIVIDDIPHVGAMPYFKIKELYEQAKVRHEIKNNAK